MTLLQLEQRLLDVLHRVQAIYLDPLWLEWAEAWNSAADRTREAAHRMVTLLKGERMHAGTMVADREALYAQGAAMAAWLVTMAAANLALLASPQSRDAPPVVWDDLAQFVEDALDQAEVLALVCAGEKPDRS